MLHLIKLSVGSTSFASLDDWQHKKAFKHSAGKKVFNHGTTMKPRRIDELMDGGSIYWVVKGFIIGRNKLAAIEFDDKARGRARCSILCALPMIPVVPRRHRAFQGWRYFKAKDAPPDMTRSQMKKGAIPPELMEELADLGLL